MIDEAFWRGRRVLVTGHAGFKGSWLTLWLQSLGSEVYGMSRGAPSEPSLYRLARVQDGMASEFVREVRDYPGVAEVVEDCRPEIVIHLAAQPLVRRSFADPRETYETNVMGTVNVLEAVRQQGDVRVVINVTSDKCYENRGWDWGYRENEPLGGFDPYSSSKAASELVTSAYRSSFFADPGSAGIASVRAGNVIGGGDWGADRLVPDVARCALEGRTLHIRNPNAIRPWQHVINPLSGYLLLAQSLWSHPELADAWNFGPPEEDARPVSWVVEQIRARWDGRPDWEYDEGDHPHEAQQLKLDSSRARAKLGWRPLVGLAEGVESIVDWYREFDGGADMRDVTMSQIARFAGHLASSY